jgi:hypothetical protein
MSMNLELIDSGWDRLLYEAVNRDHSELRIICPFIKKRIVERLLRVGRPNLVHVITRFNLREFFDGVNTVSQK